MRGSALRQSACVSLVKSQSMCEAESNFIETGPEIRFLQQPLLVKFSKRRSCTKKSEFSRPLVLPFVPDRLFFRSQFQSLMLRHWRPANQRERERERESS